MNKTKNILFLITGITPQVVTETLWALACDKNNDKKWVPDEIHVLGTLHSMTLMKKVLMEQGQLKNICDEYNLQDIKFDDSCLHCICDDKGNYLDDLRTPKKNEYAANMICHLIQEFTQDDNVELHVSIAGGRKTLSYYAGYALSLYGRFQDSLSHVLVDQDFERLSEFYYPAQQANIKLITTQDRVFDTHNANVLLIDMPFVRLRSSLNKKALVTNASFADVIQIMNLSIAPVKIVLDTLQKKIIINNIHIDLAEREFAFFASFLINAKFEGAGFERPKDDNIIEDDFLKLTNRLYDGRTENDKFDKNWFSYAITELKKRLIEKLDIELTDKVLPKKIKKTYKIDLPVNKIEIIANN